MNVASISSDSACCIVLIYLSSCRLGIRKEELPKLEEQLELKIAKAQLEELKKDALEAMETQKKRYAFLTSLHPVFSAYMFVKLHATWPRWGIEFELLLCTLIQGRVQGWRTAWREITRHPKLPLDWYCTYLVYFYSAFFIIECSWAISCVGDILLLTDWRGNKTTSPALSLIIVCQELSQTYIWKFVIWCTCFLFDALCLETKQWLGCI